MKSTPIKKNSFIVSLKNLQNEDFSFVPKNVSLLALLQNTLPSEMSIPSALVIKSSLFQEFFRVQEKNENVKVLLRKLNGSQGRQRRRICRSLQEIIIRTPFSKAMEKDILFSYRKFVRPSSSHSQVLKICTFVFGEAYTFLHPFPQFLYIKKEADILKGIKQALAFYFSTELASESEKVGFDYGSLRISLLIEKTVPSETHGTLSTFDPVTHFDKVNHITSLFGDTIFQKKQGFADAFFVSKDSVGNSKPMIVSRTLGEKAFQIRVNKIGEREKVFVPAKKRDTFSLQEFEVLNLSKIGSIIEHKYGPCRLHWQQREKKIIIESIELIGREKKFECQETYILQSKGKILAQGKGIGKKIVSGKLHIFEKSSYRHSFHNGDIVFVKEESFGFRECIKKSSGLIINESKRYSDSVLLARELFLPIVLIPEGSLKGCKYGKRVTLSDGVVYEGTLPFEVKKQRAEKISKTKTKTMVNIENPDNAFILSQLETDGVGMVRAESLFAQSIPIHPLALVSYPKIKDKKAKKSIEIFSRGFPDKKEWSIEKIASDLAKIALAFYPSPVMFRFSDFQSVEFSGFVGAGEFKKCDPLSLFDIHTHDIQTIQYREAFGLQCSALRRVRDEMGLTNIIAVVPFCLTPQQGEYVISLLKENGLERGKNGLEVYGRCELPAHLILAKDFLSSFDGFSIDIQNFEQNNKILTEKDEAIHRSVMKSLFKNFIYENHKNKKKVHYQNFDVDSEFTEFLLQQKVDALCFPPDIFSGMKTRIRALESTVGRTGNKTHKGFLSLIVGFGALAATFIGMGSGCTEVIEKEISQAPTLVSEYLPPAKIREELEKNFQKQIQKFTEEKMIPYSESGFASFDLQYPVDWSLDHSRDIVTFRGSTSTEYVRIFTRSTSLLGKASSSSIYVNGTQASRGQNIALSDRIAEQWVEIVGGDGNILIIEGGGDKFEKILGTVILKE